MNLSATITDALEKGRAVTLADLGGLEALEPHVAESPLFPYVASALVNEWSGLDEHESRVATGLITTAIATSPHSVALAETCSTVIPSAADLRIATEVKNALRERIRTRGDQRTGAFAAIALRWLANLALATDAVRGAVLDTLSEVGLSSDEEMPFAVVAAQVAGLAYDQWRDRTATDCLVRLTETDGDADAWFGLGQARLADALEAGSQSRCLEGLRDTLECFDFAAANGEGRPDAVMYGSAVRFVTEWATGASAEMLDGHRTQAETALAEYMTLGHGLPETSMWTRPRFEAESAWIELVQAMSRVAPTDEPSRAWYVPQVTISALADVYRTANSLRPARTEGSAGAPALPDVVVPALAAPFVEQAARLAFVDLWLEQDGGDEAQAFADVIKGYAEQVVSPKVGRPGGLTRPSPV